VAELLVDVLLEVRRQRLVATRSRPCERRLRQRDGRADDLVLEDEVLGPQLAQPRLLDERVVCGRERADEDAELTPEARARRVRGAQ
jgi:hypothetical protein